ncbi:MAG TPA: glycosyltransferase family 4 protein [Thermohalobaculum sp.]|nr:glycosyltransferase family 4 protein [Thermohalobaculum sp.]
MCAQASDAVSRAPRLLFVVNDPGFFLSHRGQIAQGALERGYEVHVATPDVPEAVAEIRAMGLVHHRIPLNRGGRNPVSELRTLTALVRLMRHLRPDVVHEVTIKAVIWGGIAARMTRVPARVAAVSGLGQVFSGRDWQARALRQLAAPLYRAALGGPGRRVIFQNPDDRDAIGRLGVRLEGRAEMIRGSGVDLARFAPVPEPEGTPQVLMPARLLADKGVAEFVAAARQLRRDGLDARFILAGGHDPGNPASVAAPELARWRAEGIVEFPGHRPDIAALMQRSHLVVLPSYYGEGLPKALIEAAASGRAVVTTDMPGCRDAVIPGKTGLLVPPRDAAALAGAIGVLLADPGRRRAMGAAGRALAEDAFCVTAVVAAHLRIYDELTGRG